MTSNKFVGHQNGSECGHVRPIKSDMFTTLDSTQAAEAVSEITSRRRPVHHWIALGKVATTCGSSTAKVLCLLVPAYKFAEMLARWFQH